MSESEKAHWGDTSEDEGTLMTVDDSAEQRLWLRVGPVFTNKGIDKIPGIWIEYQEKTMGSPMQGPVLLSPSTWEKVKAHIDGRLKDYRTSDYGPDEKPLLSPVKLCSSCGHDMAGIEGCKAECQECSEGPY